MELSEKSHLTGECYALLNRAIAAQIFALYIHSALPAPHHFQEMPELSVHNRTDNMHTAYL